MIDNKDGLFETLQELIIEHERFTLIVKDAIRIKRLNYLELLSSEEIDSLCKLYNADGIICLESMKEGFPTSSITKPYAISHWRLLSQDGELDNTLVNGFGNTGSAEVYVLNKKRTRTYTAGSEASFKYIRRVAPSYYQEVRTYYHKGNTELKLAGEAIKNGDYATAKSVLDAIKDEKGLKNKVLKRLAHNLALLYELEREYQLALMWAKRSQQKGNAPTIRYVNTLEKLVNEQPLIELQLQRE